MIYLPLPLPHTEGDMSANNQSTSLPSAGGSIPPNATSPSDPSTSTANNSLLGGGCYDNSPGTILSNTSSCPIGFYCPHIVQGNTSTLPTQCTPSATCAESRLLGQRCSDGPLGSFGSQGLYEPGTVHDIYTAIIYINPFYLVFYV